MNKINTKTESLYVGIVSGLEKKVFTSPKSPINPHYYELCVVSVESLFCTYIKLFGLYKGPFIFMQDLLLDKVNYIYTANPISYNWKLIRPSCGVHWSRVVIFVKKEARNTLKDGEADETCDLYFYSK